MTVRQPPFPLDLSSWAGLLFDDIYRKALWVGPLRLVPHHFRPQFDTGTYRLDGYRITPNAVVAGALFFAPLILPVGIRILRLSALLLRNVAGDAAVLDLRRVTDPNTEATVVTLTSAITGANPAVASADCDERVTSDQLYHLRASFTTTAAGADAGLYWATLDLE